jgi:iron(III) transport system substrate-binding protein
MKKILFGLLCACTLATSAVAGEKVVNLYSAQQEHLIRPVLEKFTKKTGIEVQLITGDAAALVTRLQQEGKNTQADALLTADIGNLYQAKSRGLLQVVKSETLEKNIPSHLRDSEGLWYGFTMRTRLLFMRKDEAKNAPKNYTDLADSKWKSGILVRSSDHVYNQSLLSSIIFHQGEREAEKFVKGLVENLARTPQGGDRDQLAALAAGEGKVAIANSYYYLMLVSNDKTLRNELVAKNVVPVLPNQETTGAHVNIRGGGVAKYAKHKDEAVALLEYLSQEEAQGLFANLNREYPVNIKVKPSPEIKSLGDIKFDNTPLEKIGSLQAKAIAIMDKAGWR